MSQPIPKPVRTDDESNLDYNLRVVAWKRKERARKRKAREQVDDPAGEAEAAEPDDREKDIKDAWTRSERELEKIGE